MLILAIESSCDETAAAVVRDGRQVLSNRIASQIPLHQRYGGVVPEIASRAHLEQIVPIAAGALEDAGLSLEEIDAVAATRGPGLIGCLLVGLEYAKALSAARGLPLAAMQHIAGHLYSPWIGRETDAWGEPVSATPNFEPMIGLALSGGHSSIVHVKGPLDFEILGETLDDAVGEAYDKIAKLIGLGYPGGPIVDNLAQEGDPKAFDLPRPLLNRPDFDFSFSGLKTAFARQVEKLGGADQIAADRVLTSDLCAAFQAACVDVIIGKAEKALNEKGLKRLAITGGVACNKGLRTELHNRLPDVHIALPAPEFCTDNAAMIAGAAYHLIGQSAQSSLSANAVASLDLEAGGSGWQA